MTVVTTATNAPDGASSRDLVPSPASVVTVPAAELARALTNVIPFALRDDTIPALNSVRVSWDADGVAFEATDRSLYIRETVASVKDATTTPGECLIWLKDAPNLARWAKGMGKAPVTLTLTGEQLAAESWGNSLTVKTVEGGFPDYAAILAGIPEDGPRDFGRFGMLPERLVKLGKLKTGERLDVLEFNLHGTASKPLGFSLGSRITGMVMPVRLT